MSKRPLKKKDNQTDVITVTNIESDWTKKQKAKVTLTINGKRMETNGTLLTLTDIELPLN